MCFVCGCVSTYPCPPPKTRHRRISSTDVRNRSFAPKENRNANWMQLSHTSSTCTVVLVGVQSSAPFPSLQQPFKRPPMCARVCVNSRRCAWREKCWFMLSAGKRFSCSPSSDGGRFAFKEETPKCMLSKCYPTPVRSRWHKDRAFIFLANEFRTILL